MALFNIGGLISSFARPKTTRVQYSGLLDQALNDTTSSLPGYRVAQDADLSRLTSEVGRATENIRGLEAGDQSILSQLIGSSNVDPMKTYRDIGAYQTGVLDKLAKDLGNQGRAQDNALLARFGAGGRGGSTYQTNSIVDRLSRNLAPVYAQTLGNLGRDTGIITGARTENAGNIMDLINARASVPTRTIGLQTIPSNQRTQNLNSEIAALLGLGEGYRGNTAGYREDQNKWAQAFGAVDNSLNSAADLGLFGGSLRGGGGVGGLFGSNVRDSRNNSQAIAQLLATILN